MQLFLFQCQALQSTAAVPQNGLSEVLASVERLRRPDSPAWPPRATLQAARAAVACLTPPDMSDRERGMGATAESLQLLLLEIANANGVGGSGAF